MDCKFFLEEIPEIPVLVDEFPCSVIFPDPDGMRFFCPLRLDRFPGWMVPLSIHTGSRDSGNAEIHLKTLDRNRKEA